MIIYIPFNSNDFNSIFTTLSISPRNFYPVRNFSFKRATKTLLNPSDNTLLGYTSCFFTKADFDFEDGFTINLELDVDEKTIKKNRISDPNIYCIDHTVHLYKDFRLIFRTDSELEIVFSKSSKSIETKFVNLARRNSCTIQTAQIEVEFINENSLNDLNIPNQKIDMSLLDQERRVNKLQGSLLCFMIGVQRKLGPEFTKLKIALKQLQNISTIFFNSVSSNDYKVNQERLTDCLNKIRTNYDVVEPLDEYLILNNESLKPGVVAELKNTFIFGLNALDILKAGLISLEPRGLPLQLQVEKLKTLVNLKYPLNATDNNFRKINATMSTIAQDIEALVRSQTSTSLISYHQLLDVTFEGNDNALIFNFPDTISEREQIFLKPILKYLLNEERIVNVESMFSNRELYLTNIGIYLSKEVQQFDKSTEREYIRALLKSFKSLRTQFDIESCPLDTLKSLGLLFTMGRDLVKYLDGIDSFSIENVEIPLSIWGAAYGLASLPKTLTSELLQCRNNELTVLGLLDRSNKKFKIEINTELTKDNYGQVSRKTEEQSYSLDEKIRFESFITSLDKMKKHSSDSIVRDLLHKLIRETEKSAPSDETKVGFFELYLKTNKARLKGYTGKKVIDLYKKHYCE